MKLEVPLMETARKWGYVRWRATMDKEVRSFLRGKNRVDVWFEDSHLGVKNVDYDHRRISVGYARTRKLPGTVRAFVLSFDSKGMLRVKCK